MPVLNYAICKESLKDHEKERIVCLYLSMSDDFTIDWAKATRDYNAASVESFKKGITNITKRLEGAGAKDLDALPDENPDNQDLKTPKKSATGRKRKATAAGLEDTDEPTPDKASTGGKRKAMDESDGETAVQPPKKRGRPPKAQQAKPTVTEDEEMWGDGATEIVKEEHTGED